jgi:hypothetical protein
VGEGFGPEVGGAGGDAAEEGVLEEMSACVHVARFGDCF